MDALRRRRRRDRVPRPPAHGRLPWFVPLVTTLCVLSLAAHLGTGHWVYDRWFFAANASPVLLLLAVFLLRGEITQLLGWCCAIAAVWTSFSFGAGYRVDLPGVAQLAPSHVTLAVAYVLTAWVAFRLVFGWAMAIGALAAVWVVAGPTWQQVLAWADAMRPKTLRQWGIISVAMSFVTLILGAIVSLRREPDVVEER